MRNDLILGRLKKDTNINGTADILEDLLPGIIIFWVRKLVYINIIARSLRMGNTSGLTRGSRGTR
jgi:hypothetical protein